MANNLVLSNVYNQYLTTYAPQKSNSRYDAHKRSELKNIYNSMVRVNRDAPLYKIDTSEESRECVIGLKEESRVLHNNIVSVLVVCFAKYILVQNSNDTFDCTGALISRIRLQFCAIR